MENLEKRNITEAITDTENKKQTPKKRTPKKHGWIVAGICIALLAASIFTSFYGIWERTARENLNSPFESEEHISYLYQNCYVLYHDLYNRQNVENKSYAGIYLDTKEEYEWLLDEEFLRKTEEHLISDEEIVRMFKEENCIAYDVTTGAASDNFGTEEAASGDLDADEVNEILNFYWNYKDFLTGMNAYFTEIERNFGEFNVTYDYLIQDTETGEVVTNLTDENINIEEQYLYLTFCFDENGNVSLGNTLKGNDITKLRKSANAAIRDEGIISLLQGDGAKENILEYISLSMPRNCKVTFCISNIDWSRMEEDEAYTYIIFDNTSIKMNTDRYAAYIQTPCLSVFLLLVCLVFICGLFLPAFKENRPWEQVKLCGCMPLEGLLFLGYLMIGAGTLAVYLAIWVNAGSIDNFAVFMPRTLAVYIVYGLNLMALTVLFLVPWYIGICFRTLRERKIKEFIKERSIIYRIFPYVKKKIHEVYTELEHFDVTGDAKKLIRKIVLLNGIILCIIGIFPLGWLAVALVYSVLLYWILKKYISSLQQKYGILLNATNKIAEGNLNTEIKEDLGVFEPFKPEIAKIQSGFKKAVDEEMKSQKMKSELITNVSHDLKTPLTAIITYINLLQQENITEEQRKEYLDTLERKSLRLKVLIEDLFEVSKANSQNMTLDIVDVDIVNLIKQVTFELTDKLKESNLDVRMDIPAEKIVLPLDSQKTYRIFENLLVNVAKYALPSTRVYIQCLNTDKEISIVIKNITAKEIQVGADELTERFVRGDISRNTEGSGLGLAIVKSFTELQGGSFKLDLDGDLFKVTVSFTH